MAKGQKRIEGILALVWSRRILNDSCGGIPRSKGFLNTFGLMVACRLVFGLFRKNSRCPTHAHR